MLGFELDIKETLLRAIVGPEKVITIALTKTIDSVFLNFGGTNFRSLENVTWINTELQLNDYLSIEIKDIERESEPIEVRELSCQRPLSEEEQQQQNEKELNQFYEWNRILHEKGLI